SRETGERPEAAMRMTSNPGAAITAALVALFVAAPASATVCIVPDNGGTADLPPNCSSGYLSPSDVHMIIDGLPPGQTITVDATHSDFFCTPANPLCSYPADPMQHCSESGGALGGEKECNQSQLTLTMNGT